MCVWISVRYRSFHDLKLHKKWFWIMLTSSKARSLLIAWENEVNRNESAVDKSLVTSRISSLVFTLQHGLHLAHFFWLSVSVGLNGWCLLGWGWWCSFYDFGNWNWDEMKLKSVKALESVVKIKSFEDPRAFKRRSSKNSFRPWELWKLFWTHSLWLAGRSHRIRLRRSHRSESEPRCGRDFVVASCTFELLALGNL